MLEARNVTLHLGGGPVLRGVSLAVRPGEVLAVIGPNGAGKSSLLHLLSGSLRPTAGAVTLDGRPLAEWRPTALARRRAVLPQTPLLSFPFRVFDVVLLGRSPHVGYGTRDGDQRIAERALRVTDTLHLAERTYTTLSGGERQRVQLARVLAQIWPSSKQADSRPKGCYVLLDEPTNNLDIVHQQATLATARRLAASGLGVVAVLHDPNLAALYADRVCLLNRGRVVAEGSPDTAMTATLMEATFGLPLVVLRHPDSGRSVLLPAGPAADHLPLC